MSDATTTGYIRQILLKRWDPLTIQDIPECADEYDPFVEPVYQLLVVRPTAEQLAADLKKMEEDMGIVPGPDTTRLDVAARLLRLPLPTS